MGMEEIRLSSEEVMQLALTLLRAADFVEGMVPEASLVESLRAEARLLLERLP